MRTLFCKKTFPYHSKRWLRLTIHENTQRIVIALETMKKVSRKYFSIENFITKANALKKSSNIRNESKRSLSIHVNRYLNEWEDKFVLPQSAALLLRTRITWIMFYDSATCEPSFPFYSLKKSCRAVMFVILFISSVGIMEKSWRARMFTKRALI